MVDKTMMITAEVKKHLLELMQRESDAKADFADALAATADKYDVDKALLKKVITAHFKDETSKLRNGAQMTLDLLDATEPPGAVRTVSMNGEHAATH